MIIRVSWGGESCTKIQQICINKFLEKMKLIATDDDGTLHTKDITGSLDIQIRKACKFVERNMRVFAIKAPNRIETPQFSLNAVFEAAVNAVVHRGLIPIPWL
ncbi:hypothetical protein MASR2M78_30670 [Treponema sp.]